MICLSRHDDSVSTCTLCDDGDCEINVIAGDNDGNDYDDDNDNGNADDNDGNENDDDGRSTCRQCALH